MILLSAGHYPASPGACAFDWCEHEEAKRWVSRIVLLVRQQTHVDVVTTGPLGKKIKWINGYSREVVDLVVEIHFNSNVNAKGCETLYCPGSAKGKQAAQIVQDALAPIFPPSRGIKEGWYRADKPGHKDYEGDVEGDEKLIAFLSQTNPVALILEPDFISQRARIEANRQIACENIAVALIKASESLRGLDKVSELHS